MAPVKSAVDPVITPATDLTTNIGIHSRKSVVAAHARSERACQEFERRAQLLRECLCSEDFLGLFGGFCGRDSGIGPAQRAKTTIWN